jgi:hypothetical protein
LAGFPVTGSPVIKGSVPILTGERANGLNGRPI